MIEGGGSRFGNGSRPQATCMSRILRCIMRCMLKPFAITAPSSETTHRTRRDIYPPIKTGAPTTSLYLCAPIPVHVPLPRLTSAVSLPLPAVSHDADSSSSASACCHRRVSGFPGPRAAFMRSSTLRSALGPAPSAHLIRASMASSISVVFTLGPSDAWAVAMTPASRSALASSVLPCALRASASQPMARSLVRWPSCKGDRDRARET